MVIAGSGLVLTASPASAACKTYQSTNGTANVYLINSSWQVAAKVNVRMVVCANPDCQISWMTCGESKNILHSGVTLQRLRSYRDGNMCVAPATFHLERTGIADCLASPMARVGWDVTTKKSNFTWQTDKTFLKDNTVWDTCYQLA